MRIRRHAIGIATAATLVTCAMTGAPAADAAVPGVTPAVTCYGSAHSYSKASGDFTYPSGTSDLGTTSACTDINIKTNTDRYVLVCLLSGAEYYCQSSFTLAHAGQWTTVATNVLNGTRFIFDFRSDALSNGYWAA
jgi:hypothetical protein